MDINSESETEEGIYRILFVEDDPSIRNLVRVFLKKATYTLELAENGEIGVEKFKNGEYDLVLMDIQMPVMDGLTACREIRLWEEAKGKVSTPIVALTAHGFARDEVRSGEAGCEAHLIKPIGKQERLDAIHRYAKV